MNAIVEDLAMSVCYGRSNRNTASASLTKYAYTNHSHFLPARIMLRFGYTAEKWHAKGK